MKTLINKDIPIDGWKEFLVNNPHGNPFQSFEFYEFSNSVFGFSAHAISVVQQKKIIALTVITIQKEPGLKGFFSRRGIIYGGPLIDEKYPESSNLLLKEIHSALGKKVIYIESRNFSDYSGFDDIFSLNGWKFIPYLNITINLQNKSLSEVISGMKYNRRREIRISLEMKAKYSECKTEENLASLFQILRDLYKDQVKLPLPGYDFFKALWLSCTGKVFIVKHNDKIIGGSFCLVLQGKAIYTMYYCGLRNYDKKIYPAHLAVLAAIEHGIKNGLQYLDFMGAGKKGEEYGVRKYKQEFGGQLNEYGRYIKIQNRFLYILGKFILKMRKSLQS